MKEHLPVHPVLNVLRLRLHPIRPAVRRLSRVGRGHKLVATIKPLSVAGKPLIRDFYNKLLVLVSRKKLLINIQFLVNLYIVHDVPINGDRLVGTEYWHFRPR